MSVYEAMMATRREVTPADVRKVRQVAGMTQREMAEVLRVSVRTMRNWESSFPPQHIAYALDAIMDEAELQALARETGAAT